MSRVAKAIRKTLGGNWFGWLWVGWHTALGVAILGSAIANSPARVGTCAYIRDAGHGTALLLVGASILFAAVIPPRETLQTSKNKLPIIAGLLTGAFAYIGTAITLMNENRSLLGLIYLTTVYFGVLVALPVAIIARSLRR